MATFEVINKFKEKEGSLYNVGDKYPQKGKATKERIKKLSTKENEYKRVFIKKVEEVEEVEGK